MLKAGWEAISSNYYSLIIKFSAPVSEKKLKELQQELQARLEYCFMVNTNKQKKSNQIKELLLAVGVTFEPYVIVKSTHNQLPTFDVLIPLDRLPSAIVDVFMEKCRHIFHGEVSRDEAYITFSHHALADGRKLVSAISDLQMASRLSSTSSRMPDEKILEKETALMVSPDTELRMEKSHENSKKNHKACHSSVSHSNHHSPAKESTHALVSRMLHLKPDKLHPMRMPWSMGTHYSILDPKLKDYFKQTKDYDRVEKLIQQGNVTANNTKTKASSACIVPSAEVYKNVAGKTQSSAYKLKTTDNIRIFGNLRQLKLSDGDIANVVIFDGVKLKAH